ncbi:MAG: hypothetical protein ABW154_12285 [Dyella sp.]
MMGSSGMAVAASTESQDLSIHASIDSNHDNGGGSSASSLDAMASTHDSASSSSNNNSSGTSGNLSSEGPHRGATSLPARQASLGWQSLLPGSIQ